MAQGTNTYDRYDIVGSREDLSDQIYNISPTTVPIQSNIGMEKSDNTFKEWQTDSLPDAKDNAQVDGDAFSGDSISNTTRLGNYHQIAWYGLIVSRRADIVNKAGRRSELGYQIARHAKALRNDIEVTITKRKRSKVGDASSPSETAGMPAWIRTNDLLGSGGSSSTLTGGTPSSGGTVGTARAFSEAHLLKGMRDAYDSGGNPTLLNMPVRVKQGFSSFLYTSSSARVATQYQDQGKSVKHGTTVVGAVDVYVSDFGVIDIVPNRFSPSSTTASELFLLDTDMWALSFLSPFHVKDIASNGDAERRMIIVDYCLVARNEASSSVVAAINNSSAVTA